MGIQTKLAELKVDITLERVHDESHSLVRDGIEFTEWVKRKTKTLEYLKPLVLLLKQLLRNHMLDIRYFGTTSLSLSKAA